MPGEPDELTSTVVLTSPQGRYVDVRVYKRQQYVLPEHFEKTFAGNLEWAFAGTSKSHHDHSGKQYTVWDHWVDSFTKEPEEDKGEMIRLENGDVLEKGTTIDPETGDLKHYEELWTDLPLTPLGDRVQRVCVVLQTRGFPHRPPDTKGW